MGGSAGVLASRITVAVGIAALPVLSACGRPAAAAPQPTSSTTMAMPSTTRPPPARAEPTRPDPQVGAIFLDGSPLPTCSGSVLHSSGGDLILTAAHCLADGLDSTFMPGFSGDAAPENTWSIDAVYLDPRWVATQDPVADYAIARVGNDTSGPIEAQVGGGLVFSPPSGAGTVVAVTGYGFGVDPTPIRCQASIETVPGGFLSLPCSGLIAGTSGAPWITAASKIAGLTGGLHGGGCEDDMSYSPPFDEQITRLLARAEAGGPGDSVPAAFADDCSDPPSTP